MKTQNSYLVRLTLATLSLAALLTTSASVQAAKPPSGGGGTTAPAGTIYYYARNADGTAGAYSMRGDGTQKTSLGVRSGYPSRLMHGGKRWFLRGQNVEGTDPTGAQRYELFVEREGGAINVQLTDDPTLHFQYFDWTPAENANEAVIAGVAWRWNPDGTKDAATMGVYSAILRFDAVGNVLGLDAPPAFLFSVGTLEDPIYGEGPFPDIWGKLSFSPDMTKVVADHFDSRVYGLGIRIIDVATGMETVLVSGRSDEPMWSPDGTKIAFVTLSTEYALEVISPNGTGRMIACKSRRDAISRPTWSPDSAYLAFTLSSASSSDIYRVPSKGGSASNLTNDLSAEAGVLGWW